MHSAYIGIGTNIEPRSERMRQAIESLKKLGIIERESTVLETAPYGYTDQANFLNAAVLLRTELELADLHEALRRLEKDLGRSERPRWHEREIDFDILFYDNVVFASKTLTVPHPEIQYRMFVLLPLQEIAPNFLHPVFGTSITGLLRELKAEDS